MNNSKKKSDLANTLDDLRCDDPKKRLNAVQDIKEVAVALGPSRVRSELVNFLACKPQQIQNSSTIKKTLF